MDVNGGELESRDVTMRLGFLHAAGAWGCYDEARHHIRGYVYL